MMSFAQAIIFRDHALVNEYLRSGIDVNAIDEYGFTPLIEAAITNDVTLTRLLLEYGANVQQADLVGGTALHWAVENSNVEMSSLLLAKGADPNAYNNNGEPVLIKPLLRKHSELKNLLYRHEASARFAMDYINIKLLGHRYDMRGSVDIVSVAGDFVEVSLEGFFLEFSLNLVCYSLEEYRNNYAARKLQQDFPMLDLCIDALRVAGQLIQYQQYQTKLEQHREAIDALLDRELLIIPSNYAGHAVAFILYQDTLVLCDRRKLGHALNGINIYKIRKPQNMTKDFIRRLLFKKDTEQFVTEEIPKYLQLELKTRLLIMPQVSGNCSWANVVACIPAIHYLFSDHAAAKNTGSHIVESQHPSMVFYQHWRDWDRLRALYYFMQDFEQSDKKRKASIASLLGALLFQRFQSSNAAHIPVARRILKILKTTGYEYVLQNYLNFYYKTKKTPAGLNLKNLIETCENYI